MRYTFSTPIVLQKKKGLHDVIMQAFILVAPL
jgi:hypothetical protein